MLLGLAEWTQQEVSLSVIIPHLQVFLLLRALSSLVKRKSICTDVYERGDCLDWKGAGVGWLGTKKGGESIVMKWTSRLEN